MAYYIAKELNNVFLRSQKKIDLIILTTSLYLIQVVPTIIFILPTYNIAYFMLKEHPITLSYIYVGSSVFLPIIFYFVYRHMIKKSNNNTKFNVIVFPLLVIAIGLSFASLYYLAIIRY
jgi:hypothetical protein